MLTRLSFILQALWCNFAITHNKKNGTVPLNCLLIYIIVVLNGVNKIHCHHCRGRGRTDGVYCAE